jgi:hypothetical protein
VSAEFFDPNAPFVGKGRWTIPLTLLKDRHFITDVKTLGQQTMRAISFIQDNPEKRTDLLNPQTIYTNYKTSITRKAQERAKKIIPRLDR